MNKDLFHLLVVDDDDRIRDLVKQYLEEKGFLITTANNAEDAKKKVEIIKFDLLILDIMMPGESGLDLTKNIKKNNNTPIILLTAKGETKDRIEGLELGADDYLSKPFEPKELLLRIKNILNKTKEHAIPDEIYIGKTFSGLPSISKLKTLDIKVSVLIISFRCNFLRLKLILFFFPPYNTAGIKPSNLNLLTWPADSVFLFVAFKLFIN